MSVANSQRSIDQMFVGRQTSLAGEQITTDEVKQNTACCRKQVGFQNSLFDEVEQMLAEQRAVVERALAFNSVIAERLAMERFQISHRDDVEDEVKSISLRPPDETQMCQHSDRTCFDVDGGESDLSKPLLLESASAIKSKKSVQRDSVSEPDADRVVKVATKKDVMSWHMFPAFKNIKELVDKSLHKPEAQLFKKGGFFSWFAQTSFFNTATLTVIVLNTGWIAYDTDCNHEDLIFNADWQFQVAGQFFCTYFVLEIIIRILAMEDMCMTFMDPWFLFEIFLVALMVWEDWISLIMHVLGIDLGSGFAAGSVLRIFRLIRLLRVARTGRILSSVPELFVLIKGMLAAMRSVMCTLGLLALIIYIFAIVFTQLLADDDLIGDSENPFTTVPHSANFLLLQVLCGFDADFAAQVLVRSPICYFFYLIYILMGSLTIMNMLIGILVDVVSSVANDDKEETFQRDMEEKVEHLAKSLDVHQRGRIAKVDFEQVFKRPEVILSLTDLGVDVAGLMDFAHFVFQENEDLSYANFEHMVVQFRGGKSATVKDVMHMRKQMSSQLSKLLQAYDKTHRLALGEKYGREKMTDSLFDSIGDPLAVNKTSETQNYDATPVKEGEVKKSEVVPHLGSVCSGSPVLQGTLPDIRGASFDRSFVLPRMVDTSFASPRDAMRFNIASPRSQSRSPPRSSLKEAVASFAAHYGHET